jgi:DNA-binding NarL/FixJ family response regulator/CRP-like cAMP-binding protein
MRVILADDAAASRSAWRKLVQNIGIAAADIVEAQDAPSLLKAVSKGDVSLVILSWTLSGLSGFTLLGDIRTKRRGLPTPVIAVGDPADLAAMEASVKVGLTGFVVKQADPSELGLRIKKALFGDSVVRSDADSRAVIRTIVSTAAAEADLPFFMQLPSDVMSGFLRLSKVRKFPSGVTLIAAGHAVQSLHVLTLGQAELREEPSPARTLDMGECFGEVSFLTEKPNAVTVVAVGPVEVNSLDRPGLAELIQRHPNLAGFLSSLVSRRTKVRAGRPPGAPQSGVGGSLASMPFSDLVQMLHSTRKSGVLTLEEGDKKAGLVFEEGEVRHAWVESLSGEAAFNRVAAWTKGLFYFRAGSRTTHPMTIRTGTLALLMEAMRLVDEASGRKP